MPPLRRPTSTRSSSSALRTPRQQRNVLPSGRRFSTPCSGRSQISTSDVSNNDEEIDDNLDHVIMAIDRTNQGKIGCAYFVARHELLYCMEDVDHADIDVLETLKVDIQPTVVLFSARVQYESNPEMWRRQSSMLENDSDHRPPPYEEILRPSSEFKHENGLQKLSNIRSFHSNRNFQLLVPGDEIVYDEVAQVNEIGLTDQPGHLLTIGANINVESRVSMGCIGVVLDYLQRKRASEYLDNDPLSAEAYRVSGLEMFTLTNNMFVNVDTLTALQVIQSESHPSIANQGPGSWGTKESLSIYGLFQKFVRTPQGRLRLRQVFLRPSLGLDEIAFRHDFISILVRPENQSICDRLSKSLSKVGNIRSTLTALHKGIERGSNSSGSIRSGVWISILEFCFHTIDIGDALNEVSGLQRHYLFNAAREAFEKTRLRSIGTMVHDVIDLDESTEQHRSVIRSGVDHDLDLVKNAYNGMEQQLCNIASRLSNAMPTHIEVSLNVLFLPQLGYHVVVPRDESTGQPIWDGGDDGWEMRFSTAECFYFKNYEMKEMDVEWGDMYTTICEREIEYSHGLAQRVLDHEQALIKASNLCGELDYLLALTHGAIQYKLTRPRMVERNVIDVRAGRHLLQEMTLPSYVPNNAYLIGSDGSEEPSDPSMILLTGPNYSGKSVYMKQVGLIVYMAQAGSFVPAESATLGIVDKILTRINTAETVSRIQSAFMTDLQQIAQCLKACTQRSLVIIDEFGKGTHSCDGAGLSSGVLQHLLSLGNDRPKVLASTHFHEIFERQEFDRYPSLAMAHMQIHVDNSQLTTLEASRVTYLYNIQAGRSTLSYGNQCAAVNGIPKQIVQRAMVLADLATQGVDLVTTCAHVAGDQVKEAENAESTSRRFLSATLTNIRIDDIRKVLDECFSDEMASVEATSSADTARN